MLPRPALPAAAAPGAFAARRRLAAAGAALLAAVALAGCSNSSTVAADRPHLGTASASEVNGVQQVTITTGNDLRFHPSTIVVHTGRVRLILKNTAAPGSGPPHNVQFAALGATIGTTLPGTSNAVTFTVNTPGRYSFVCTFHVDQGQTGTMIVKS